MLFVPRPAQLAAASCAGRGTPEESAGPGSGGAKAPPFQNRGEKSRLNAPPHCKFVNLCFLSKHFAQDAVPNGARRRPLSSAGLLDLDGVFSQIELCRASFVSSHAQRL